MIPIIKLLAAVYFTFVFANVIRFSRRWMFSPWAKDAAVVARIMAIGWGVLGLVLVLFDRSISSEILFPLLFWLDMLLGGILVVIVLTILIAGRVKKRET
jgi:hypothetical protein